MKSAFSHKKSGYIPTLDGWRAVAILGVMLFHGWPLFPYEARLEVLRMMGEDDVRLFFAISGILICTKLMDEEGTRYREGYPKTGDIAGNARNETKRGIQKVSIAGSLVVHSACKLLNLVALPGLEPGLFALRGRKLVFAQNCTKSHYAP